MINMVETQKPKPAQKAWAAIKKPFVQPLLTDEQKKQQMAEFTKYLAKRLGEEKTKKMLERLNEVAERKKADNSLHVLQAEIKIREGHEAAMREHGALKAGINKFKKGTVELKRKLGNTDKAYEREAKQIIGEYFGKDRAAFWKWATYIGTGVGGFYAIATMLGTLAGIIATLIGALGGAAVGGTTALAVKKIKEAPLKHKIKTLWSEMKEANEKSQAGG